MGRRYGRRVAAIAALAVAACWVSGVATPAAHARARPAIRVRILDASQRDLLKRRAVSVRVSAARSGTVRLFASSRERLPHAAAVVVTGVRDVRLRRGRARRLSLRLDRAGLRELRGCSRRWLVVEAATVRGPAQAVGAPVRTSRAVKGDSRLCRAGAGGRTGRGTRGGSNGGQTGGGSTSRGEQQPVPYTTPADAGRCDFLDPAVCLQPWPNDYFTTPDGTTATGRRLNLNLLSMPRNRAGKPIDPTDYNRGDGFSPGDPIVTKVPGLDTKAAFDRSGIVPLTDMGRAFAARQPVVVIDTQTKARWLVWAELDANPKDPANVNLIIRPGRNFREGGRYIVALRNLVDASGNPIPANPEFRLYRDRTLTTNPTVEARRAHFESIFRTLAEAGIDRDSLYRAWDFTVASGTDRSERMLAIRNDAFRQLGDTNLADLTVQGRSPQFKVTQVTNYTPQQNSEIARDVEGTVTVPCYLDTPNCASGGRFLYPPGSTHGPPLLQPIPGNTTQATFRCIVPRVALAQGGARPSLYGHGLFGSRGEVDQGQLQDMASEHNFVFCATEWIGMACSDVPTSASDLQNMLGDVASGVLPNAPNCDIPNVATILTDLSNFPTLADRVQQGMLNFMYLGRAMIHPQGLGTDPAFQDASGHSVIDNRRLFYDGNSQGGIIGGSLIAVEPDLDRGVIGVPGMNYSTLLQRSTDFGTGQPPQPNPNDPSSVIPEYAYPLYTAYPNELERPLILSLLQNLWDRAEADGYAEHMTGDPYPDTPAHHVLMQGGLGDHQVAQIAAETEARTIGARVRTPYADPGRDLDVQPAYGLQPISSYPFDGSAFVLFDIGPKRTENGQVVGTNPPPPQNTPPSPDQQDPHEYPRRSPQARAQKDAFLRIGGLVVNTCGDRPCYAGSWHGP